MQMNTTYAAFDSTTTTSITGFIEWLIQANVLLGVFIMVCFLVLLVDFIHRKNSSHIGIVVVDEKQALI
jgi:hypothetical protein